MPRSLSTKEVKKIIKKYINAAKNAVDAGFDGVEIHGANGYLVDQFMRKETNKRKDRFGKNTKNRARFALKIVDGIIDAIGADKTAIRLSPQAYAYNKYIKGDERTYRYLFKKLNKRNIAYVHLGAFSDNETFDYLDDSKASEFIRKNYKGNFVTCGSYTAKTAALTIEKKSADLVAIGRPLIANPDFIEKIKTQAELIDYDATMLTQLI